MRLWQKITMIPCVGISTTLCLWTISQAQQPSTYETRPVNAVKQTQAFENQTRAPMPKNNAAISTEVIAKDLPHIWSIELLPDGVILAAAKEGAIYTIKNGVLSDPIKGVPEVASGGQGGLLDLALAPDFETSKRIYFSFSEVREDGNGTSVGTGILNDANGTVTLADFKTVFRQMPSYNGDKHFGSRLVFNNDDELFVTTGDRSDRPVRVQAQDLNSGLGKIFRIKTDGSAYDGNPFLNKSAVLPEIWSYGHRNIQGAAIGLDGKLWTVEHGPRGGDELNQPKAGLNYGWPSITYGIEYGGSDIGDGLTAKLGMEQPVYYWDPVIGPSGMALYTSDAIPEWKNKFLIGGLVAMGIVIVEVEIDKVKSETRLPLENRIRDVKVSHDGSVYALTETRPNSSSIIKITGDE